MTNFEWLITERKDDLKHLLANSDFCIFNSSEPFCTKQTFMDWLDAPHSKFQEGDLVKVIRTGGIYSTYDEWVVKNIDDPTLIAKWAYDESLSDPRNAIYKSHTFKVIKVAKHSDNDENTILAYIQDTNWSWIGKCFLINEDGIEKC